MDDIMCGYCPYEDKFKSIIVHLFKNHEFLPLKYRERQLDPTTGTVLLTSKLIYCEKLLIHG